MERKKDEWINPSRSEKKKGIATAFLSLFVYNITSYSGRIAIFPLFFVEMDGRFFLFEASYFLLFHNNLLALTFQPTSRFVLSQWRPSAAAGARLLLKLYSSHLGFRIAFRPAH